MAEGWTRSIHGTRIEAFSAGVDAKGLDPLAVQAMREAGVDITAHRSKNVNELRDVAFDVVVTVCDNARESCPVFPGNTRVVHRGFDDPPYLARHTAGGEEALVHYRRIRDEIREFVETLPGSVLEAGDC